MSITIYTPTGKETFHNAETADKRIDELLERKESIQVHYMKVNNITLDSSIGCQGGNLDY